MKVLGVLQNQWFHDPDRVRALIKQFTPIHGPRYRQRLVAMCLFGGCKTGRILKQVFGAEWCERIVWEEASPEIGGHSASVFPADKDHLREVLAREQPAIVIGFGEVAFGGLKGLVDPDRLLWAPHPAARHPKVLEFLRATHASLLELYNT